MGSLSKVAQAPDLRVNRRNSALLPAQPLVMPTMIWRVPLGIRNAFIGSEGSGLAGKTVLVGEDLGFTVDAAETRWETDIAMWAACRGTAGEELAGEELAKEEVEKTTSTDAAMVKVLVS
jgi:hypothetical protein